MRHISHGGAGAIVAMVLDKESSMSVLTGPLRRSLVPVVMAGAGGVAVALAVFGADAVTMVAVVAGLRLT